MQRVLRFYYKLRRPHVVVADVGQVVLVNGRPYRVEPHRLIRILYYNPKG